MFRQCKGNNGLRSISLNCEFVHNKLLIKGNATVRNITIEGIKNPNESTFLYEVLYVMGDHDILLFQVESQFTDSYQVG